METVLDIYTSLKVKKLYCTLSMTTTQVQEITPSPVTVVWTNSTIGMILPTTMLMVGIVSVIYLPELTEMGIQRLISPVHILSV